MKKNNILCDLYTHIIHIYCKFKSLRNYKKQKNYAVIEPIFDGTNSISKRVLVVFDHRNRPKFCQPIADNQSICSIGEMADHIRNSANVSDRHLHQIIKTCLDMLKKA